MVEQFQRILEQIIIPQYKGVDDVDVSQFGMDNNFLKVTYYINDNLNPTDARKLIEETESLYRMLGIKKGDFTVSFRKGRGWEQWD